MSAAAKSLFVFAVYLSALGIILIAVPNILLSLFGIQPTGEVWIRVVGMLVLILAVYYVRMAKSEVTEFFWISVYVRAAVPIFFTAFVLLGYVEPVLILFGIVDLAGALWTWCELKTSR